MPAPKTICDICREPGHCCKKMILNGEGLSDEDLMDHEAVWILDDINERFPMEHLPFVPFGRHPTLGCIHYTCPKLGADGRCTDYENRPLVCQRFEPLSDPLCCMTKEDVIAAGYEELLTTVGVRKLDS